MKMREPRSFETSVTVYESKRRDIREDFSVLCRCSSAGRSFPNGRVEAMHRFINLLMVKM
jgi:hypothetical protein